MTFQSIIELVENLKKKPIRNIIDLRMQEFEDLGKKNNDDIFKELCFCLTTANFSAHGGIKIQNAIKEGFMHLPEEELAKKLAELGHRFPNARAKFICGARIHIKNIKENLQSFKDDKQARSWVKENVKGLGMKEASHFLRNIGYKNLAIIDFHIVDLLVKHGVIEAQKSKSLTEKKYLEIENILNKIAQATNTNLGELDLYLWYEETGKVLK
ncbi:N-glycosylase/DNA lyase [Candidatus Pacearchaeota archaeon]|nr:N-glycosylase/DNA lyase [Candidatus Pacearchaeota archaeon]